MPTNTYTSDFVQVLTQAHRDNGRRKHFALEGAETVISTMWLTPFVYQYFIYNSLYQVDWDKSLTSGIVRMLDARHEVPQQEAFEVYLRTALQGQRLHILADAFRRVKNVPVRGEWTRVRPDQRISIEDGEQFFRNIEAFQATLNAIKNGDESLPFSKRHLD